jgi:hypothetical protein
MSSCRRPSAEKIALRRRENRATHRPTCFCIGSRFHRVCPTQIVTLLVPDFVQAVSGKKYRVSRRQVRTSALRLWPPRVCETTAPSPQPHLSSCCELPRLDNTSQIRFQSGKMLRCRNAAQAGVTNPTHHKCRIGGMRIVPQWDRCASLGQSPCVSAVMRTQPTQVLVVHPVAPGLSYFRRSSKDSRNILAPYVAKMKFLGIRDAVRLLNEFRF